MEQALAPRPRTDAFLSEAIRAAGIVGAGGAGFPTYVKYGKPTPLLVVNGAESEPGYVCDKLLFRDRAREFARLFVFLKDIEAYERIIVGVEEGARPFMGPLEDLAAATDAFEVATFPNLYKYGQEKALIKVLLDRDVAKAEKPPDVGVTVNNNETLWNVYRALFEGRPVTTKFLTVYGETPAHLALEAPVGALATDLLALAGLDEPDPSLHLFDGGPVLCEPVPDWTREPYGIRKTTNGLLLVSPERLKTRAKAYPRTDGPALPDHIENVEGSIARVRIPLGGRFGAPAAPVVDVGARVMVGDVIAEPPPDRLGVPVHASITGVVVGIDAGHVDLEAPDREVP
ncbi:MAG TPA: proton-conducting membrane transporter [Candidatus Thermoplasmatota archaeon]|nr:proton-conducting membrane transporter [Candidatus Thermoplasmatota archaeon]